MQSGDQAEAKRIYDVVTGLGVEWVRDEPPMERHSHFRLLIGESAIPFSASYEFGIDRAKRENPEMSIDEVLSLMSSDRVIIFKAQNIAADFDRDNFLQIWRELLSRDRPNSTVGVIYWETNKADGSRREWSKGV